jgi:hypothetical protein
MRWTGIAVDATVLATTIRVNALRKRNIGGVVMADNPARVLFGYECGWMWRRLFLAIPTVILRLGMLRLKPTFRVGNRSAPFNGEKGWVKVIAHASSNNQRLC